MRDTKGKLYIQISFTTSLRQCLIIQSTCTWTYKLPALEGMNLTYRQLIQKWKKNWRHRVVDQRRTTASPAYSQTLPAGLFSGCQRFPTVRLKTNQIPSDTNGTSRIIWGSISHSIVQLQKTSDSYSGIAAGIHCHVRYTACGYGKALGQCRDRVLCILDGSYGRAVRFKSTEHSSRLYNINVIVKMSWEAIACRSHQGIAAVRMFPDMISLYTDQLFNMICN